ncbi:MAG: hypothetical protein QGI49_04595 [SAR202 cluster bacterium]|nr:hypothetical protein [SAR202 cluster bacterium]
MPEERRPAVTGQERNRAARQVVADQASERALLSIVDVLAEIARESGAAQVREQSLGGLEMTSDQVQEIRAGLSLIGKRGGVEAVCNWSQAQSATGQREDPL